MENSRLQILEKREDYLKKRITALSKKGQWFLYPGICLLIITIVLSLMADISFQYINLISIIISLSLIIGYFGLSSRIRLKENEIKQIDLEQDIERLDIEFKELKIDKEVIYAEKTLRLHNDQLKKYYDLNLGQSKLIFRFGLFCIIIGFLIVLVTFYLIVDHFSVDQSTDKIITGTLGGIGAILSNYVAALYLKMSSNISESLNEFHNKLIETHKILIGNLVVSKINDKVLKENTYSEIAKLISRGNT